MKIDINGCFSDDIHAICIRKDDKYLTADPEIGWTDDITLCAGFLSEREALLCIEELREKLDMDDANLIWRDSLKSIYFDMEELRKFAEDMQK